MLDRGSLVNMNEHIVPVVAERCGQTQDFGGENLRGLTPRLPVPRTATGHRKRSSLTDPGAALSNFFSLKQVARSARSCGQTESKKRPELWAPQREAAARRPVRIDETAPHCPPRAAKISYLKIDRYLCSYVAETGRQTKRPPRERQPESPLSTGRPWRPDSKLWWRESARAYSPAPRSENGDRA